MRAFLGCLFLMAAQVAASAEPPFTVTLGYQPSAVQFAFRDCDGIVLSTEVAGPLPSCVTATLLSPTRRTKITVDQVSARVAGASSGLRAVYGKDPVTGKRLTKSLGNLVVGTLAKPSGYLCDPTDFPVGSPTYFKLIDLAAPAALRGGYVTGCKL